jgi:multidrug efflux pump subunit AcrA (membrane-fusion protein)
VTVAAEVAGRIKFKSPACEEATYVTEGTLLFEIDPVDYEIAVRRATKELEQMENALEEWQVERDNALEQVKLAEQDVTLAVRDVERLRRLASTGGAATSDVEQAQRSEITTRNTLLALRNQIRLLDARYDRAVSARDLQQVLRERALLDLARTKIHAPCNGTIVSEDVEQDGYVQPGATLVVMNDTSIGEVVCQVEVEDMFWLWGTRNHPAAVVDSVATVYEFPRCPVTIEFPCQHLTCEWDGHLARYGGSGIDPKTRTVPCQIDVPHPQQGRLRRSDGEPVASLAAPPLTSGMFVTVRAFVAPYTAVLGVPVEGLRAGSVVWIMRDDALHIVPVKVARRMKDRVLIYAESDSLRAGDEVIVSPLAMAQEGMLIRRVASR